MTKDEFGLRLSKECAVAPGAHVLAAVSGGADSMALLCFFLAIRDSYPLTISAAHVEHGIRGGESEADLTFVRAFCAENGIAFYASHVDAPGYAAQQGCGVEDAARTLRYEFLQRTADATGADAIALAHHAGDQAETVLLHASRGSDVRGLCAMRYRSGRLIRPLLGCTAQELRDGLISAGQPWREDRTNQDTHYARNRLRHCVMPELERVHPGAGAALCRLACAAQRDEDYFERQIDALNLRLIPLADGAAVEKAAIDGLHPALLSRVLVRLLASAGIAPQRMETVHSVMAALDTQEAAVNLTDGAHAYVGKQYLCMVKAAMPVIDVPLGVPGITDTPFGRFETRTALPGETGDGKLSQRIPAELLRGARVTARREGDMMTPFGRHSAVKLKKLMIDAGIERAMRNSVPVLRRDDKVLFAVGLRPAQCCKGTEQEEQMIVRFLGEWPCGNGETNESGGQES